MQLRGRLDLDDKNAIDDQIESLRPDIPALVDDLGADLAIHYMPTLAQLDRERGSVERFEQPEMEGVVYLEERTDHRVRQPVMNELAPGHTKP